MKRKTRFVGRPAGHQFRIFDRPAGPIRATPDEAIADMLDAGMATYDGRQLFTTVPARIVRLYRPEQSR